MRRSGRPRAPGLPSGFALYELDRDEVPLEVSIDEAVRLARRYSSEDAARLVNGILGKVAKEAKR